MALQAAIDLLPNELLDNVFSFFDSPAPSESRLKDQPGDDMLRNTDCPLKNASLVSKRWRARALPILFHTILWTLDRCDQLLATETRGRGSDSDPFEGTPILAFLHANDLARHVRSLTIMICHKEAAPAQHSSMARSATVYHEDNNWLWDMLFSLLDPLRLTIIASPQTLARLLSCMVFVGDADFFSSRELLHVLSLSRSSRRVPSQSSSASQAAPQTTPPTAHCCSGHRRHPRTTLFTIRSWTHLLLNENSSIRAYRSYHYFDRRPPSILGSLLGQEESPNNVLLVPPTVTSLSYIAIFPLSAHFNTLVAHLPPVEHFYVQLVPRNDILLDKDEMNHVQPSDLWLDCQTCYDLLISRLPPAGDGGGSDADDGEERAADAGWRSLRRVEMSDWEVLGDSVQLGMLDESGWHHKTNGVFVKGPAC